MLKESALRDFSHLSFCTFRFNFLFGLLAAGMARTAGLERAFLVRFLSLLLNLRLVCLLMPNHFCPAHLLC